MIPSIKSISATFCNILFKVNSGGISNPITSESILATFVFKSSPLTPTTFSGALVKIFPTISILFLKELLAKYCVISSLGAVGSRLTGILASSAISGSVRSKPIDSANCLGVTLTIYDRDWETIFS